ncbi:MAG: hypothetical protein IKQ69_09715 [Oscillospiraceae bacterium]|nr:hypothetical protein [Oscillospiraceae bacterium]
MGRRSLFLLLTAAALLLAAAAWAAAALGRYLSGAGEQVVVRRGALEDRLVLNGVVLRTEIVLTTDRAGIRILERDRQRVSAGVPLAIEYDTGEEQFRSALLLRLRTQAQSLPRSEEAVRADYAAALARRELAALPQAARELGQALGLAEGPEIPPPEEELEALRRGEEGLLLSPAAGYFVLSLDGWEDADPRTLTPAALRERLESARTAGAGIGKLAAGNEWSFCALVQGESAARFSPGDRLTLRLGDGTDCAARVVSVVTQGQDTLVTFRCREHMERVLSLRQTELTAVFSRCEGLLLPLGAIREQEGVFTVRRAGLPLGDDTAVTVLFTRDGMAVVSADGLREGMAVLMKP